PHHMITDNGHHLIGPPPPPHHLDESIYLPAVHSPNGTLRPMTPHGEPIYFEGVRNGGPPPPPMPMHLPPPHPSSSQQIQFLPHPQTGNLVPCTVVSTLSRKELKELEKQKAAM